jgi:small subunit ribosomal protein S20
MANTRSAGKRARQTERRTVQNQRVVSGVKTQLKKTRAAIAAGDRKTAFAEAQKLHSVLDRAGKSGRLKSNAINRHKSEISRRLTALKS